MCRRAGQESDDERPKQSKRPQCRERAGLWSGPKRGELERPSRATTHDHEQKKRQSELNHRQAIETGERCADDRGPGGRRQHEHRRAQGAHRDDGSRRFGLYDGAERGTKNRDGAHAERCGQQTREQTQERRARAYCDPRGARGERRVEARARRKFPQESDPDQKLDRRLITSDACVGFDGHVPKERGREDGDHHRQRDARRALVDPMALGGEKNPADAGEQKRTPKDRERRRERVDGDDDGSRREEQQRGRQGGPQVLPSGCRRRHREELRGSARTRRA